MICQLVCWVFWGGGGGGRCKASNMANQRQGGNCARFLYTSKKKWMTCVYKQSLTHSIIYVASSSLLVVSCQLILTFWAARHPVKTRTGFHLLKLLFIISQQTYSSSVRGDDDGTKKELYNSNQPTRTCTKYSKKTRRKFMGELFY